MGRVYILYKDGQSNHTYSENIKQNLQDEGWEYLCYVDGWNPSVRHNVVN